uniref:Uncharacterized protein n=1 Tax=Cucumis melo TaxID=3656 RepID=A0A9I9E1K2_CUCME
ENHRARLLFIQFVVVPPTTDHDASADTPTNHLQPTPVVPPPTGAPTFSRCPWFLRNFRVHVVPPPTHTPHLQPMPDQPSSADAHATAVLRPTLDQPIRSAPAYPALADA